MPNINVIRESHAICDILKYASYNSFFLFDIDNTLIETKTALGGDQWFGALYSHTHNIVEDERHALVVSLAIWHELQKIVKGQMVEKIAVDLIKAFQDIGMPVIAISARTINIESDTLRQLQDNNIDFKNHNIDVLSAVTNHALDVFDPSLDTAFFSKGIIYCSGKDKGRCLQAFLDYNHIKPKHIIMIDDKLKCLEQVHKVVKAKNINFHGFRYGLLDNKVEALDFHETKAQLTFVKERLHSDVHHHIENLELTVSEEHIKDMQFEHELFHNPEELVEQRPMLPQLSLQRRHSLFETVPTSENVNKNFINSLTL